MPRRGRNYKKVLISLDGECVSILNSKKNNWDGFNASAWVRKAIKAYERPKFPNGKAEIHPEEVSITYE